MLLFLYGFAINLDSTLVKIGVLRLDDGPAAVSFERAAAGHPRLRDPPRRLPGGPAGLHVPGRDPRPGGDPERFLHPLAARQGRGHPGAHRRRRAQHRQLRIILRAGRLAEVAGCPGAPVRRHPGRGRGPAPPGLVQPRHHQPRLPGAGLHRRGHDRHRRPAHLPGGGPGMGTGHHGGAPGHAGHRHRTAAVQDPALLPAGHGGHGALHRGGGAAHGGAVPGLVPAAGPDPAPCSWAPPWASDCSCPPPCATSSRPPRPRSPPASSRP